MSSVVVGVESNQVTVQNTVEDFVTNRQDSVNLATRERSVQEEAKLDIALRVANLFAEQGRQKHEMVVVYPDEIVILDVLGNLFGKQAVCFLIGIPC